LRLSLPRYAQDLRVFLRGQGACFYGILVQILMDYQPHQILMFWSGFMGTVSH